MVTIRASCIGGNNITDEMVRKRLTSTILASISATILGNTTASTHPLVSVVRSGTHARYNF